MTTTSSVPVTRRGLSLASVILGFVMVMAGILVALETSRILEQRAEAIANGRVATANLAMSLTQHANLTFRTADTVLTGLVERLEAHDEQQPDGIGRIRRWMNSKQKLLPQIAGLSVSDQAGQLIISSQTDQLNVNISDREHFQQHRDRNSDGLFVGAPIFNRVLSRWTIPVSRRYSKDGAFAGVATAFVELRFFQDFYANLDIGEEGAILLMSADKKLMARRPFVESNIGRDMSQSNIAKALERAPSGTLELTAVTDGVRRLNSYQSSDEYPIVIAIAKSVDEILLPWRSRAVREAAETCLLLIAIATAGFFVWRMANQLSLAKQHLDTAINAMPHGLCLFDSQRRLVFSNARFRELYGYPAELLEPGTPLKLILNDLAARGTRQGDMTVEQYIDGISGDGNETLLHVDGRVIAIDRKPAPDGGWVATHVDITDSKHAEQNLARQAAQLRRANEYFECAIKNMPQGVCLFDAQQRVIVANSHYAELYNLDAEDIRPGTTLQKILERRREKGTNFTTSADVYRSVNVRKSQEIQDLVDGRTISISRRILSDGGWLTTHEDITERRQGEKQIAYLAKHDVLTGLANRASFMESLREVTSQQEGAGSAAIFLLDLDRFKLVNDTLGHAAGDQLLKEVAGRLSREVREHDLVARLGGDEFAIIQKLDRPSHEAAISLALRLIEIIGKPVDIDGQFVNVGTSIGIAFFPEHDVDDRELLKKADLALYSVKEEGRNDFRIYDAEMMKIAERQKLLEGELMEAIDREQFELYYQPVLDLGTRRIVGAEALVRWNHPKRGLLAPDQFIPLAEDVGLIGQLGELILQRGCRDAVTWPADLKVAINVSAHQFRRGNLFDIVLCALVESGLNPERLELEITESALLDHQAQHLQTLRQLRNIGVSVVLDDFGTGYSSARYLTLYPFDKIKIDKSFVQTMATQRESSAIVASTLALAKGLDIPVTAEGVETPEQMLHLTRSGVDFAQGYLIGRPAPLGDFLNSLGKPLAEQSSQQVA